MFSIYFKDLHFLCLWQNPKRTNIDKTDKLESLFAQYNLEKDVYFISRTKDT